VEGGKKPTNELERIVQKYEEECVQDIKKIPASVAKARLYFLTQIDFELSLEFTVFFKDQLKKISHPDEKD
jgi:hypothetical protein